MGEYTRIYPIQNIHHYTSQKDIAEEVGIDWAKAVAVTIKCMDMVTGCKFRYRHPGIILHKPPFHDWSVFDHEQMVELFDTVLEMILAQLMDQRIRDMEAEQDDEEERG